MANNAPKRLTRLATQVVAKMIDADKIRNIILRNITAVLVCSLVASNLDAEKTFRTDQFQTVDSKVFQAEHPAIAVAQREFDIPDDQLDNDYDDDRDSDREIEICPKPSELSARFKQLDQIQIGNPNDGKMLPPDCSTNLFQSTEYASRRADSMTCFAWQPTNFFHNPLYFEDVPLERYGQRVFPIAAPVVSGLKFLSTIATLPYKMAIDCPHDCVTSMGHYRPGSCTPCTRHACLWDGKAGLVQAGTVVGLALLLP